MKGRTLTALLMLLAMLAVCLVCVPALSTEHPWDADSDGSRDGDGWDPDPDPEDKSTHNPVVVEPNRDQPAWYWYVALAGSYYFTGQTISLPSGATAN